MFGKKNKTPTTAVPKEAKPYQAPRSDRQSQIDSAKTQINFLEAELSEERRVELKRRLLVWRMRLKQLEDSTD